MNNDLTRAKELFMLYRGDFFLMTREGKLQEYKEFKILKQQEIEWINEIVNQIIASTDLTDSISTLSSIYINYQPNEIINYLSGIVEASINYDSFEKVRIAEEIIRIDRSCKVDKNLFQKLKKDCMVILESIKYEFNIKEKYYKDPTLTGILTKEKLVKRVSEALKYL
ncbi:MAG: hypothetical protein PQJ58_09525 [Spirochaetales bacterium]|nr:hypothetical protein [Spirochaetales bacterium]